MTTTKIEPKPLTRPLHVIATEIRNTWVKVSKSNPAIRTPNVNYAAAPYLNAMADLSSLDEYYFNDPATDVVRRFLSNAGAWRGEDAARIKAELNAALAWKSGARS